MNKYVGIPFIDKGRTAAGVDCWGLVKLVFKEQFKIDLPDFDYLSALDAPTTLAAFTGERKNWLKVATPQYGDLIVLLGESIHIGIMIEPQRFLHVRKKTGTTVGRTDRPFMHVVGYFRHRDLANG